MRKLFLALLLFGFTVRLFAQVPIKTTGFERKGFTFGFSAGAGILSLSAHDTTKTGFAPTIPNLQFGWMVSPRLAIQLLLPGSTYKYHDKTRGFEGYILTAKYWPRDNFWVMGGTGVCFDAPAFWTVNDPKKAVFNTGLPAITIAAGYEILHRNKFAIDLQYRFYYGQADLDDRATRKGISNMLSIGFNWY
jgi:hypothetical protein